MEPEIRRCPVEGCPETHPRSRLMCRRHWYMVPKELRDRVWKAYDQGRGVFTDEYMEAREVAIAAAEQSEEELDG